jgi:hypothetical protein
VFPGCNRRAHRCEIDHTIPYSAGGSTSPENLGALCKRHHTAKHTAGWSPHREPDGRHTWTSPTGHQYDSRPPDLPKDHTTHGTDPPF